VKRISSLFFVIVVFFCACKPPPTLTHIEGTGLGTYYHITIADKNNISKIEMDSIISVLNNTASIFNPNSLVSRINRNETDSLNSILKEIIEVSLLVCEETNGAFDFTIGALVNLWGFGKDIQQEITEEEINKALETVGYQKIKISDNQIIKENPDTQLNFNAIAKGYCVDMITNYLTSMGIENFLVDIGGELCIRGKRAPNQKWRVGIQKPTTNKEEEITAEDIMELTDIAVATSGNYRNYKEENGKRYGHTINPRTGYPETNTLLSATVLASTCTLADAYATALMVMGEENAKKFVSQHPEIQCQLKIKN